MPLAAFHAFCSDLSSIWKNMQSSVTELCAKHKDVHWQQWVHFCLSQAFDPPPKNVFAKRFHDGQLSCSNKPLRSRTVSETIRSVGQALVVHAHSGDTLCCPVATRACQVFRLRSCCHSISPFIPLLCLASYINNGVLTPAGGARMALLQGKCDSNVIKFLDRWHSDCVMRYLHHQSLPIFKNLASLMFNNGTYSFLLDEWLSLINLFPLHIALTLWLVASMTNKAKQPKAVRRCVFIDDKPGKMEVVFYSKNDFRPPTSLGAFFRALGMSKDDKHGTSLPLILTPMLELQVAHLANLIGSCSKASSSEPILPQLLGRLVSLVNDEDTLTLLDEDRLTLQKAKDLFQLYGNDLAKINSQIKHKTPEAIDWGILAMFAWYTLWTSCDSHAVFGNPLAGLAQLSFNLPLPTAFGKEAKSGMSNSRLLPYLKTAEAWDDGLQYTGVKNDITRHVDEAETELKTLLLSGGMSLDGQRVASECVTQPTRFINNLFNWMEEGKKKQPFMEVHLALHPRDLQQPPTLAIMKEEYYKTIIKELRALINATIDTAKKKAKSIARSRGELAWIQWMLHHGNLPVEGALNSAKVLLALVFRKDAWGLRPLSKKELLSKVLDFFPTRQLLLGDRERETLLAGEMPGNVWTRVLAVAAALPGSLPEPRSKQGTAPESTCAECLQKKHKGEQLPHTVAPEGVNNSGLYGDDEVEFYTKMLSLSSLTQHQAMKDDARVAKAMLSTITEKAIIMEGSLEVICKAGEEPPLDLRNADIFRSLCLKRWKCNVKRSFLEWFHVIPASDLNQAEIWATGVRAYCNAEEASWWNWDSGSAVFFWRWHRYYQLAARKGVQAYVNAPPPENTNAPSPYKEEGVRTIVKQMLNSVLEKVTSNSMARWVVEGCWLADNDYGEQFLNFPLHPDLQRYYGIDLTQLSTEAVNLPKTKECDTTLPWIMKLRHDDMIDDMIAAGLCQHSRIASKGLAYLGLKDAAQKRRNYMQTSGAWAGAVISTKGEAHKLVTQECWAKIQGQIRCLGKVLGLRDDYLVEGEKEEREDDTGSSVLHFKGLASATSFFIYVAMTK
eukprot:jgi/Psemu1/9155/gm1.9155_g